MPDGVSVVSVIDVLQANGATVFLTDATTQRYMVEKGDFLEEIVLGEIVPTRILQRFKRKLDISISHFWHPEQAKQPVEIKAKKPSK